MPSKHKTFCITFIQRRSSVEDVGPTLYKLLYNFFVLTGLTNVGSFSAYESI